ncbi:hypothetical protein D3C76_1091970 [compost metagenome]
MRQRRYRPTSPSGAAIRNGMRQPQAFIASVDRLASRPYAITAAQAKAEKVDTGTKLP